MMASPKLMDKDEQLQLCIQRFVSDTQSMINQFSEVFIGELRRFADVCMEFSVAYRGVQEERQFLTAENKSLKDELEARTAEVDFLGKELREIREENDGLIRKLECLITNSEGEISMGGRSDSVPSRHYAVVNSMPTFPRRYSEATHGYDSSRNADNRKVSVDINLSTDIPSTSKTQILLTPPVPFKNTSTLSPDFSGDGPTSPVASNTSTTRSHSRDDISLYTHLLNNSDNNLGTLSNSPTNERSPSVDEIHGSKIVDNLNGVLPTKQQQQQPKLSNAVSSSAGTFYDCCSRSNIEINDDSFINSNRKKLLTVTDQIRQIFGNQIKSNEVNNHHLYAYNNNMPLKSPPSIAVSPEVTMLHSDYNDPNDTNHDNNNNTCAVVNVELKQLKKRYNDTTATAQLAPINNDLYGNSFIAKSPSPNIYNFDQHFDKYRCDTDLVEGSGPDIDEDVAFLLESPPVQRYNSKKISKKRKNRRKTSENKSENEVIDNFNLQNCLNSNTLMCADAVSVIPSPQIDLNRYLLVEVCHIISPSHFYLIVNDEKCGTNAFEDFLEHFQNFYKSIEEGSFNGFEEPDSEERELRLLVSIPPPTQALTIGSYWACYIDDELDWRRVQIIGGSDKKSDETIGICSSFNDDTVLVKDVDSGYSSMVHSQMIRPLTDEMARVPAFAIRASLAFIYPHFNGTRDNSSINCKDHPNDFYDQWPLECCQFFEDMTYDQILTASVLQIHHQDDLPSNDNEIAQVLLWCTSKAEDFEVFINRKLIELNYATNIADDDSWMEQFSDVNNMNQPSTTINSQQRQQQKRPDSPNIETCFNIQLATIETSPTFSGSFQSDQLNNGAITDQTCEPCNGSMGGDSEMAYKNNDDDNDDNNNKDQQNKPAQQRKIKIKTRSKKKKGPLNEVKEENKECPESCNNPKMTTITVQQPVAQISKIGEENKETIVKSSSSIVVQDPNSLLHISPEPGLKVSIVSVYNDNQILSESEKQNHKDDDDKNESKTLFNQYCQTLHHDPRLSNWIIQKHSKHITLKKTMADKICYLFRVTCYFDPNKFIGILPFGERKLDSDVICNFLKDSFADCASGGSFGDSPFKQFINEMTEFYRKHREKDDSSLRLLPEQCVFEQANSSTIVFYENQTELFLRGHIVARDTMAMKKNDDENDNNNIEQSKSVKDLLKVPNGIGSNMNIDNKKQIQPQQKPKKKTLSLKLRTIHDSTTKYLIYGIDVGRYFQVPLKNIYHLDDKFKMTKPFSIVCKLHGFPNNEDGLSCSNKIRKIIERKFLGLRFIDIDFTTERFAIELYCLNFQTQAKISFQNILNQI